MKLKITWLTPVFVFLGTLTLSAQAPECDLPEAPGTDCFSSPLLCQQDLVGYCSTTWDFFNPIAPPPFCAGADNNVQWISFVAGTEYMQLSITFNNCLGTPNGNGIQAQVFGNTSSDCNDNSFFSVSNCYQSNGVSPGLAVLDIGPLIPGEIYYFVVDGWNGDVCDWSVALTGGSAEPPPIDPSTVQIVGDDPVCTSCFSTYEVQFPFPDFNAQNYLWTLDGGGVFAGPSEGKESNPVNINWISEGTHELCATIFIPCQDTFTVCREITVEDPEDITVDPIVLCDNDLPYLWNPSPGGAPPVSVFGPGTYTTEEVIGPACCTRTITVDIEVNYPTFGFLDTVLCLDECFTIPGAFPPVTYCGTIPGTFEATLPGANADGCDSIIAVNIQQEAFFLSATTDIETCEGDDGAINLTIDGGTPEFTFEWDPDLGDVEDPDGLKAGVYKVTVTSFYGCTNSLIVEVDGEAMIELEIDTVIGVECFGDETGEIEVTVTGGELPLTYVWTGPTQIPDDVEDPENLLGGEYFLEVVDSVGCSVEASITVPQPPPLVFSDVTIIEPLCIGEGNGGIILTVGGGTPGYTYLWTPNISDSASAFNLFTGTYSVEVEDENGCTIDTSITVTQPEALSTTTVVTDVSCNGGSDGQVDLTVFGGTPQFEFIWDNGNTNEDPDDLDAGVHGYTITDANGCVFSGTVTVGEPDVLNVDLETVTNVSCNDGSDGAIDISVTGGTTDYSFAWSPGGQTEEDISGLTEGTYMVMVTDANGCQDSLEATVTQPDPLTSVLTPTNTSCFGGSDGSIDLEPGGGSGAYAYAWSPAQGNTQDPTQLSAGLYIVTLSDANAPACQLIDSVEVGEPTQISITGTSEDAICGELNGSIDITVTGGTPGYSYDWSDPANDVEDPTGLGPGSYTVTVTDDNQCTRTFTISVNTPNGLSATVEAVDASCFGLSDGALDLTITGGIQPYSIDWNADYLDGMEDSTGLQSGTYSVTVTDDTDCSVVASATINEPDTLVVTGVSQQATCGLPNGNIDITITGGTPQYGTDWSVDSLDGIQDPVNLLAGDYAVTVTDANGCQDSTNVTIDTPDELIVDFAVTSNLCFGDSTGSIDVTVTGGTPVFTFNWNGTAYDGQQSLSGIPAGNYALTVTDANSCTNVINPVVNQPDALTIEDSQTNVSCNGFTDGAIDLTVGGGTPGYSYDWSDDNWDGTEDPDALGAGVYGVTVSDANNCDISTSVTITEPSALQLSGSSIPATCGLANGSISLLVNGGTGLYTFTWSDPALNGQQNPTGLLPGVYSVTVTDENDCTITGSYDVTTPNALLASSVVVNVGCFGESTGAIDVTVSGGSPPYEFDWNVSVYDGQEDISGVPAGLYILTVTDSDDCDFIISDTVSQPPQLTGATQSTDVTCNNFGDGIIDVTVQGGTPIYDYLWSDPSYNGTQDATGLDPGSYAVTVVDANGCELVLADSIAQPDALAVSDVSEDILCFDGANGTIDLTVTGGVGQYSFDWSDDTFDGQEDLSGLSAGLYEVVISDENGCELPYAVTLTQPTALSIDDIVIVDVDCNGNSTGSIDLDVSGGVTPYTVIWSNTSQTGESINQLPQGTYAPIITDANGCPLSGAPLTVAEPTALAISATSTEATCGEANGTIDVTVSGGTPGYSFSWSDPIAVGEDPTGLPAGQYSVTVTDGNGCQIDLAVSVITPNGLEIVVTADSTSCSGGSDGSIDLQITGGSTPYLIEWSGGIATNTIDPTGLAAGPYSVTVTDADTCQLTATVTVHEPTPIELEFTTENATCGLANGSIDLTATGGTPGYTFDWTDPTVSDVEDPSGLPVGNYEVVVTDKNGCTASIIVPVNTPNPLILDVSSIDVTCFGLFNGSASSSTSGGSPPYDYSWTGSPSTGPDANNLGAGNYTLIVTDADDCTVSETVTINQPPLLVAQGIGFNATCNGDANGSIDLTVSGGVPGFSYVWNNGAGSGEDPVNLGANTYAVTVTDANNCTTTESVTIDEPAALVLNTTSQAVSCFAYSDGSINLTVQGGVTPYNFAWNGGLPAIEDPTDVSAGSYTVVVTDANGCTAAATQVVTQPDGMTLDVVLSAFGNFNVSCYNSEDGTAEVNVTGGVSPYMFLWSNGSANALTRNLAPNTDYTVTVTDANGCTLAETVNLTAPAPISADVSTASTSCEGDNDGRITIESVIGGIGDYVYSFAGRPFTPVGQQGFLPAGDYPVIVQDAAGCEWDTVVTVGEPAELVVDLGGDQLITLGESAFIDPLTSAIVDTTIWILPDSFDCPPSEWPCEVTPYFTTRYMIRVIDEKGCVAEDEILIRVEKPREIFVPNAFSPNDDGFNDYIKLYGGRDIEVVKQFLIFNRWGEKVYELRDFHPNSYPDSDGWNGTFLGKRLDPAVFVYFAEVTFIDGETVVFEGDITLIR